MFNSPIQAMRDYEIIPEPENETPRQFVLRMTGKDFTELAYDGRDYTWQEVQDAGAMPIILRAIEVSSLPRIRLRKRNSEGRNA